MKEEKYCVNQNYDVRLMEVEITNLKNIKYGKVVVEDEVKIDRDESTVIGIYGQNGSGKTAFVIAVELLDALMSGRSLPPSIKDGIRRNEKECILKYVFRIKSECTDNAILEYVVCLKHAEENEADIQLAMESLSIKKKMNGEWVRKRVLADVDFISEEPLRPISMWNLIKRYNSNALVNYEVKKSLSFFNKTSYVFSMDFFELLGNIEDDEIQQHYLLLLEMQLYARSSLLTVGNELSGLITANIVLPLLYKLADDQSSSRGSVFVNLKEPTTVTEREFELISNVIGQMNLVLNKIIPGLQIIVKSHGARVTQDGSDGVHFELLSSKKDIRIPLQYESDGILKIIVLLSYLIYMFNNKSCCLIVDELDASIFEYLLGEIIEILDTGGKGQLIFTSHNLRPLEVLGTKSVYFTTANEDNRYIQFSNIKSGHNLRNQYFRNIVVGGQKEELYDETSSYEISYAFRKAGEMNG